MKKTLAELRQKDIKELVKEENALRDEISKLTLEFKVNPPKDSNQIAKKKKKLAQLLTILGEK